MWRLLDHITSWQQKKFAEGTAVMRDELRSSKLTEVLGPYCQKKGQ
jgi:hypothetical protein